MDFLDSDIPRVGFRQSFRVDVCLRFLEKPEIMPFSVGKGRADDVACFLVNNNLSF